MSKTKLKIVWFFIVFGEFEAVKMLETVYQVIYSLLLWDFYYFPLKQRFMWWFLSRVVIAKAWPYVIDVNRKNYLIDFNKPFEGIVSIELAKTWFVILSI